MSRNYANFTQKCREIIRVFGVRKGFQKGVCPYTKNFSAALDMIPRNCLKMPWGCLESVSPKVLVILQPPPTGVSGEGGGIGGVGRRQ